MQSHGNMSKTNLRTVYRRILNAILPMHTRGAPTAAKTGLPLNQSMGRELYRWEQDLFVNQFLVSRLGINSRQIAGVRRELETNSARLVQQPHCLIHRDLQSSNILLQRGRPVFIDFQGMRLGPATYDLASLLYDPYVELNDELRTACLRDYASATGLPFDRLENNLLVAAVQRLSQAIGAYARLETMPDLSWFGRYLPPAVRRLDEVSSHLDNTSSLRDTLKEALERL